MTLHRFASGVLRNDRMTRLRIIGTHTHRTGALTRIVQLSRRRVRPSVNLSVPYGLDRSREQAQTLNTGTSEQPLLDQQQRYAYPLRGSIDAPANTHLTQTGFALQR
jgi:hypothetical protein